MTLTYKTVSGAQVKASESNGVGVVEAIVSVFGNVDSGGDRIVPGAFASSIAKKLPAAVWAHQWDKPIAKTTAAVELMPDDQRLPESIRDLGGLMITAEFPLEIEDSKQAYLKLKNALFDEYSIGYRVVREQKVDGVNELQEAEIMEWSPVMRGMNPLTTTLAIKGERLADHSERILSDLDAWVKRMADVADIRDGLSDQHILRLKTARDAVDALLAQSARGAEPAESMDREAFVALATTLSRNL